VFIQSIKETEMYLKLVFNQTSSTSGSNWGPALQTISNFATGTWTSTSQITSTHITKESSVVSGTAPTSGIYTASLSSGTTTAYITITKHHYAKGLNGGAFQARSRMFLEWNSTNGFKVSYYDSQGQNAYPRSDAMTYISSNTATTGSRWTDGSGANQDLININGISVIHCIITDHVLLIQLQTTGTSLQKDYGTWMIADLEYIPSIDNYAYTSNVRYTPQVFAYWYWPDTMDQGNGSGVTATNATGLYRTQYLDQYGTYRNTIVNTGDFNSTIHYGNQTGDSLAPVMHPRPMNRVFQVPVTSGDYAHQLIPLMYNGHSDALNNFGDPRHSRLMSCFRTSEDLGFTGDMITEGSGNFRIFRIHKCGNASPASAAFNACYAFPEFNIPYGS
jgi:hypothetical protein